MMGDGSLVDPVVAVRRASGYERGLKHSIGDLLQQIAFLDDVDRGDRVLLKPNFLKPAEADRAVITHPAFISAVAAVFRDCGCRVTVGDSPGWGTVREVAARSGLLKMLDPRDVPLIEFERTVTRPRTGDSRRDQLWKRYHLAAEILEYDWVINLPKLKTHAQMGMTLATKNLFGCVVGRQKVMLHLRFGRDHLSFAGLIYRIARTVKADLHLLDGIVGMDGNGPSNGRRRDTGIIVAGRCCVGVDRMVTRLLGKREERFPLFDVVNGLEPRAMEMALEVLGEAVEPPLVDAFRIPSGRPVHPFSTGVLGRLADRVLGQRLVLETERCIGCGRCVGQCPRGAIALENDLTIDRRNCIRCFCCQEICPQGVFSAGGSLLNRIAGFPHRRGTGGPGNDS